MTQAQPSLFTCLCINSFCVSSDEPHKLRKPTTSYSGEVWVKISACQPELLQSLEHIMPPEKLEVAISFFAQQSGEGNSPHTISTSPLWISREKSTLLLQATPIPERSFTYRVIKWLSLQSQVSQDLFIHNNLILPYFNVQSLSAAYQTPS